MTKHQIMRTIKEENNNPSIKWSVVENTSERIVLTNDYDTGINYSIEVGRDDGYEWITVRDNLLGSNVASLLKGTSRWDDYEETEQGLLIGVAIAVDNFNYFY